MSVSVRSGPASVIASGTSTAFWGNPLEFTITHGAVTFQVILGWVEDPSVEDVEVRVEWLSGGVRFDLVNFDGSDGRGSAEPVLLTDIGGELIFFHFRVFRFGKTTDRTVTWCFYAVRRADIERAVDPPGEGG